MELARTLWTEAEKAAFLRAQFALQQAHYRTHYRDADFCIIEAKGRPIGRGSTCTAARRRSA
jgi:hypothetical protein